jgi:hypothetical protein
MYLAALFELLSVVFKRVRLETFKADALEKPGRDDPIRIDVVAAQWNSAPRDFIYEA